MKLSPSKAVCFSAVLVLLALFACRGGGRDSLQTKEVNMANLTLTSSAFDSGSAIPVTFTCDGDNVSPPLRWSDPPAGTKSWALICDDPDAPAKTWVHWVLFNLPPDTRQLPQGIPESPELETGARHGKNDFGKTGYGGPCPPPGNPHRYFFKLYALDTALNLKTGASKSRLLDEMEGHILAKGELVGTYARK